ncbi:hypothetical protein GJU41_19190 [Bacillus idriensis]|uniref:Uncharacterized protein n=2 Tax=Metabacillus idriensis TaxID=324768 RepID=A0A6I2MG07_9BACI|nr:hypothetical protein [Metabacillus idriensis]
MSLRKLLNVIGAFIFGGSALTSVSNPIPSNEYKGFLLFIFGSAIIYYFLVNIYFLGRFWRIVFYLSLIFLSSFSIFMIFYLAAYSTTH